MFCTVVGPFKSVELGDDYTLLYILVKVKKYLVKYRLFLLNIIEMQIILLKF